MFDKLCENIYSTDRNGKNTQKYINTFYIFFIILGYAMHQFTNETPGVVTATLCPGIAQPTLTPKYSPILTNHILSRESILFPKDIRIVRFIECKNAYALAEMAKQYTWYSLFTILSGEDLAKRIVANDQDVINQLPKTLIDDIREWIRFFQQFTYETPNVVAATLCTGIVPTELPEQFTYETPSVVSTGIPQFTYETPNVVSTGIPQVSKHTCAGPGPGIEFRIMNAEIYYDSVYKSFVPFTNLYKLTKYESDIEKMMKEITEAVYDKPLYVSIMFPLSNTDTLTDEHELVGSVLPK